jgi:dTDP-4-dehydrorhamnose reductase
LTTINLDFRVQTPESFERLLDKDGCDTVINAVGLTNLEFAERNEALAMQINGYAVKSLALASKKNNVNLIHFSSDYVFDGESVEPYDESSQPGPLSAYARSKVFGDGSVLSSGVTGLILRLGWIYDEQANNFTGIVINNLINKKITRAAQDQFGTPTSADFVAIMVSRLLKLSDTVSEFDSIGFINSDASILNIKPLGFASRYAWATEVERVLVKLGVIKELGVSNVIPANLNEFLFELERPKFCVLSEEKLLRVFDKSVIPTWELCLVDHMSSLKYNRYI